MCRLCRISELNKYISIENEITHPTINKYVNEKGIILLIQGYKSPYTNEEKYMLLSIYEKID
jgi:hypothetical protein